MDGIHPDCVIISICANQSLFTGALWYKHCPALNYREPRAGAVPERVGNDIHSLFDIANGIAAADANADGVWRGRAANGECFGRQ